MPNGAEGYRERFYLVVAVFIIVTVTLVLTGAPNWIVDWSEKFFIWLITTTAISTAVAFMITAVTKNAFSGISLGMAVFVVRIFLGYSTG
ncbi:MAG: hypothetical protein ACOC4Y_02450 [bacterium]